MKKIFVVVSSEGKYDDYVQNNICAFGTNVDAEQFIASIKEFHLFQEEVVRKTEEQFKPLYLSMHQEPVSPESERPPFPLMLSIVGDAYKNLSDKEKAQFKSVQKTHMKAVEIFKDKLSFYYKLLQEYNTAYESAAVDWTKINCPLPDHLAYLKDKTIYDDLDIEELDLMSEW